MTTKQQILLTLTSVTASAVFPSDSTGLSVSTDDMVIVDADSPGFTPWSDRLTDVMTGFISVDSPELSILCSLIFLVPPAIKCVGIVGRLNQSSIEDSAVIFSPDKCSYVRGRCPT